MPTAYPKHGFNNLTYARLSEYTSSSAVVLRLTHGYVSNFLQGWASGRNMFVTIRDAAGNIEVCKISDIQGDNLTVSRGQDGTVAQNWPAGTLVTQRSVSENLGRIHQKGEFRTIAYNPNGVLAGAYPGEKVYETGAESCQVRWWLNNGGTKWRLLAGVKCDWEYYDDGYIKTAYFDYTGDDADGLVRNYNAVFATARDALSGNYKNDSNAYYSPAIATYLSGGVYNLYRVFLFFDLFYAWAGITAVELHLKAADDGDMGFYTVSVQEGTQAAPLSNDDYDAFTGGSFGTFDINGGLGNRINVNMPMNADGFNYIESVRLAGGIARLCLREYDHDFLNVSAGLGWGGYFGLYFNNQGVAEDRPFLRLRYD